MARCTRSVSRWSTEAGTAVLAILAFGVGRGEAQLPEGPGREVAARLCSQCHSLEQAVSLRQDRAGWAVTLRKMAALGAKGTDPELAAVLDYLTLRFPAEERRRINVNTATAIELESGLTLRRSQAAAIIAYRVQHGGFKSFEDLKLVPGVDVAQLEAKKDRLTF
jgi:competence protein ComEA